MRLPVSPMPCVLQERWALGMQEVMQGFPCPPRSPCPPPQQRWGRGTQEVMQGFPCPPCPPPQDRWGRGTQQATRGSAADGRLAGCRDGWRRQRGMAGGFCS